MHILLYYFIFGLRNLSIIVNCLRIFDWKEKKKKHHRNEKKKKDKKKERKKKKDANYVFTCAKCD